MKIAEKATLQLLTALEWIGKNVESDLVEHALRFAFVADDSIKTAGSTGYVFRFNPTWVIDLDFGFLVNVILHEAGHAKVHWERSNASRIGFIAKDVAINDLFKRRGPTELSK